MDMFERAQPLAQRWRVKDDLHRAGGRFAKHSVDQKARAVPGDVVAGSAAVEKQVVVHAKRSFAKERDRSPRSAVGTDCHPCEAAVRGDVEELPTVATPAWLCPAVGRHLCARLA